MPPPGGTSEVWKYFKKNENDTASCKICFKILKTSGNTSNMKKHLKLHPQSAKDSVSKSKLTPSSSSSDPGASTSKSVVNLGVENVSKGSSTTPQTASASTTTTTTSQSSTGRNIQLSLTESLQRAASYKDGGSQYEQLIKNLLYFICVDNRPFHTLEGKGFRRLMKTVAPNMKLPSEDTLKRRLDDIYDIALQTFTKKINGNVDIEFALTCDIWSEMMSTRSFLGVTAHFLVNGELKSKYLTTQFLSTRHTSENIVQYLEDCCQKFGLKKPNMSAIVTDNGANMVAAVNKFLEPARHLPCFAHSINRVVEKILETDDIKLLIGKVREIVKFFKNSVINSDLLRAKQENKKLKLILDVKTRWNSTYYMLERYIQLRSVVNEILLENPRAPEILSAQENNTLQKIMLILHPFEFVTKDMGGEKYITSSKVIPTVNCLRHQIQNIKAQGEDKAIIEQLKERTLKEINDRFRLIEQNHILAIATLLDPRFKNIHFTDPNACARAISFIRRTVNANDSPSRTSANSSESESDGMDFWSQHKQLAHARRQRRTTEGERDEVGLYLSNQVSPLKTDPLQAWEDMKSVFPRIFSLAKKYLIIPATSVPSERLFSRAGAIMTESRNRLTGSRLDKILFMSDCTEEDWQFFK